MIRYSRTRLENGLTLLIHEAHDTPMAVVNVLYNVGARDEHPSRTGFAHLFEHLMFGGSKHIPNYDSPLQQVGGESNAFTNNDFTNYYLSLPAANLETALWLESDRMLELAFSEKSLATQRQVVTEEFKQRYLDQPYGDMWLRLRQLAYRKHPYQWATIGKELAHIEKAEIQEVKDFFFRYYAPDNAILTIAGAIHTNQVIDQVKEWFGGISRRSKSKVELPAEPRQEEARRELVEADVPSDAIYLAFHVGNRRADDYYALELLVEILSRGHSSRFHRRLVKDRELFTELKAFLTGNLDPGLLVIEGKVRRQVTLEIAEEAIWEELRQLSQESVSEEELEKVKNKQETYTAFSNMNLLDKAMSLSYYELLGDAALINTEPERYRAVSRDAIRQLAGNVFRKANSSTLIYQSETTNE